MIRTMNMEMINVLINTAFRAGIDMRMQKVQRGNFVEFVAYLRNGTGVEDKVHAHVDVDDVTNVVYVTIMADDKPVNQGLRDEIYADERIEQIDYDRVTGKKTAGVRYVVGEWRIVNEGNYAEMAKKMVDRLVEVLKVVSEYVYKEQE